ncbi:MAG: DUF2461 domain-containing protein [Bryobacteraceae bacterium]
MPTAFAGFPPQAMTFFRSLARHNDREWFLPRKQIYEDAVKRPMIELIEALNAGMMSFAPAYVTDPGKAMYRIYRDVRFSGDKTPYKTHVAASFFRRGSVKHTMAGYYFSVSPHEIEVAGGIYLPPPDNLRLVRDHIARRHQEFRRIAGDGALRRLMGELQGDRLSRVPKGWPAGHPAADLVKFKQYLYYVLLDPAMASTPKLFREVLARFRVMSRFIDFLNAPLVAAARVKPPMF